MGVSCSPLLRVHRNKFLAGLALLIVCGAGLGIREALSADADLQQLQRLCGMGWSISRPLQRSFRETESESRPTATPWARVSRSLKQLKDYLTAVHGGIFRHRQRHASNRKEPGKPTARAARSAAY